LEKPKTEERPKTEVKSKKEEIKPKKFEIQDPPQKNQQAQKPQQVITSKIKADLLSKQLSVYLGKISEEINLIAAKSYPMQSIKRREQGTIIATITLSEDGYLRKIDFDKKKPKRLYKTTERIFKKYVFPKPPEKILNKQKLVKFKISVNFILK
jgi:outer membrane biosynthesis protein TonB